MCIRDSFLECADDAVFVVDLGMLSSFRPHCKYGVTACLYRLCSVFILSVCLSISSNHDSVKIGVGARNDVFIWGPDPAIGKGKFGRNGAACMIWHIGRM